MKEGWRTRAIGRHLIDLPGEAKTIESYAYNKVKIELLPAIRSQDSLDQLVAKEEQALRNAKHQMHGSMFVERVPHANGSVSLLSWNRPTGDILYRLDTYFRAGSKTLKYSGDIDPDKKNVVLASCDRLAEEWRELEVGEISNGIGYVVNDVILAASRFNLESWRMVIRLAGKPDVSFKVTAYTQRSVEPGLRKRAGGVLAGLLGAVAGFTQLRNREHPVGPIEADEILVAGTQDGKRTYGFKWEAPGKADSLAEPNLNISLQVGESAYRTNKESFASDEEALELWDAVVGSIRLRPGAV
ncbi:T6SS immunity protein Tli4 family protein [Cupriavidus sp. WKF15]|uniref:T6SS immunity protein Tli4 family protein n=1 Tax=Cupriavidus sp. WKF15 TaxID=3032282 RepID=UPI0023E0D5F5|nr:T6SS immunity protein Tli4 family protein [Cupriavidus sp. WKF15]WER45985.1 T6SS immunity protein Tli4 family protein [Cupriavidus sp. WKF15]